MKIRIASHPHLWGHHPNPLIRAGARYLAMQLEALRGSHCVLTLFTNQWDFQSFSNKLHTRNTSFRVTKPTCSVWLLAVQALQNCILTAYHGKVAHKMTSHGPLADFGGTTMHSMPPPAVLRVHH